MPTDFNGITGNLTLVSPNGERIELGEIERIDMSTSSSGDTLNSDNNFHHDNLLANFLTYKKIRILHQHQ